jgi:hypothetical protein
LLSTSSARESHEWDKVQAGVFSHEVRSGLYGAADADGDGQVSYREIAAFVERANAALPNQRFRPDVYARPPAGSEVLLDLSRGLTRRLEIDGGQPGHFEIEDARGIVLAEFHNAPGQSVKIVRPGSAGKLYVAREGTDREWAVPTGDDVIALADLAPEPARTRARAAGAAHEAFSLLFALGFGEPEVLQYRYREREDAPAPARFSTRERVGYGLVGLGAAALGGALYATLSAQNLADGLGTGASQLRTAEINGRVSDRMTAATALYGVAGAAVVGGVLTLLWPERADRDGLAWDGAYVRYRTHF